MIIAGVLLLAVFVLAFGYLMLEHARTLKDLREANTRLHQENRQLVEALCEKNGQHVSLKPPTGEGLRNRSDVEAILSRRASPPPYFKSKEFATDTLKE